MAIDKKYGEVEIPGVPMDEPVFILRGQDAATPQAIMGYAETSLNHGSSSDHAEAARAAGGEIRSWQEANPDRVKAAD